MYSRVKNLAPSEDSDEPRSPKAGEHEISQGRLRCACLGQGASRHSCKQDFLASALREEAPVKCSSGERVSSRKVFQVFPERRQASKVVVKALSVWSPGPGQGSAVLVALRPLRSGGHGGPDLGPAEDMDFMVGRSRVQAEVQAQAEPAITGLVPPRCGEKTIV